MRDVLVLLLCVGAGTVGGVFFAFSTFVMRALSQLPPKCGVAAMQRINVVVLNPLFLGVFMGSAALGVLVAVSAFLPWTSPRSPLLFAAALSYCLGSFLVTVVFNVPRNERLAAQQPDSPEAGTYWARYLGEWTAWNHVRTAASLLSAALCAWALRV